MVSCQSLARFGLSPGLLLSAPFLFVRHFLMTIVLQYKLHKCAIFAFVYAKTSASLPKEVDVVVVVVGAAGAAEPKTASCA